MSIDPKSLYKPRWQGDASLASASTPEVVEAVAAFFDLQLADQAIDGERAMLAGRAVAVAGHVGVDAALAPWLSAHPSEQGIEVFAWFLAGYWSRATAIDGESYLRLADEVGRLPMRSMAYAGALLAMFAVVTSKVQVPDDQRETLRALLLDHLDVIERAKAHPGIASRIAALRAHRAPPRRA